VKLEDIRKLNPCYDPNRYLPEDWQGTVADILRLEACPEKDRIWVAVRLIDEKASRLFAAWRAREALLQVPNPDPRSMAACEFVERYVHGQATEEEMEAVARAAWAAEAAARATRRTAWVAWDATWAAARVAAGVAAGEAVDASDAVEQKNQIEKLLEMVEGRGEK
jgi:hypothetical protein